MSPRAFVFYLQRGLGVASVALGLCSCAERGSHPSADAVRGSADSSKSATPASLPSAANDEGRAGAQHGSGAVAATQRAAAGVDRLPVLEAAFAADTVDGAWTDEFHRLVNDDLTAALPNGSRVRSIECRSSMCRIETSHRDRERFKSFVMTAFLHGRGELAARPTFSSALAGAADAGEGVVAASFVAREGHDLPAAD